MSGSKPRKNWKCVNPKCDANLNPTTKSPKLSTKWFYRPTGISSVFPHAKAEEVEYCCRSCSDKHRKIKQDEHANALRPKLRSCSIIGSQTHKKKKNFQLAGERTSDGIFLFIYTSYIFYRLKHWYGFHQSQTFAAILNR